MIQQIQLILLIILQLTAFFQRFYLELFFQREKIKNYSLVFLFLGGGG